MAVASLVVEHGLQDTSTGFSSCQHLGFSRCGSQVESLSGMWDLPGSGIDPTSLASAGRFLTTGPQESPTVLFSSLFSTLQKEYSLFWLHWILIEACRIVGCGMWNLVIAP